MAAYRTRSNTQKLQRLIEFLKERDCDSAANLEETAQVFLNDVKPKAHIEGEKFLLSSKECQSEKVAIHIMFVCMFVCLFNWVGGKVTCSLIG